MTKYQESLVLNHLDYASVLARGFARKEEWFEDLQAEAWLALSICAVKYRPDNAQDACFVTYCTPYINGVLAQFVMREYRGAYLDKYERKMARMVSLDQPMGDDEDSYTMEETLASPGFDEWQQQCDRAEVIGLIVTSLDPMERELFDARFGNGSSAEALEGLAAKRGVSVRYLYTLADKLFGKMCRIVKANGLTC